MVTCGRCKGTGSIVAGGIPQDCPVCSGSGQTVNPRELKNREQVFDRLLDLAVKYLESQDTRTEVEYKEQVFQLLKDNKDVDYNFDL